MIKRAFFYTTRKRGKALILLLTLVVISTFVLTGLSILAAADQSALSLRQSVGGSIKLELDKDNRQNWTYQHGIGGVLVDYAGTPITDADIEKVMSVKGIRDYNGIGDGSVFAMDFSFIPGISFGQTRDYSRLPSVSNSEYFNYFRRGAFKLVEGRSNRKYLDESSAAKLVEAAGFDPYDKTIKGITNMEKLLGKKRFLEILSEYVVKPKGKPTLVPDTDKRPAINAAAEDFKSE